METLGLSTDDTIFFWCACALLLVNLLVYCREAPVLCRTWYDKVKSLRWRDWYPNREKDQIREAFLFKETCARKVIWARRLMSYALPLPACGTCSVLWNMWAGNAQWMSVATIWSLLLLHVSFLMVHLVPSVITASVLDLICLAAHGFLAFLVSPLGSPNFNDVFILQLVGFMVLQIVFVAVAARYTGVLVSHSLVVGVVLWRVSMETDFASGEPDTVANSRTLVFCNIVCTGKTHLVHPLSFDGLNIFERVGICGDS